jgi:hypothetical protein
MPDDSFMNVAKMTMIPQKASLTAAVANGSPLPLNSLGTERHGGPPAAAFVDRLHDALLSATYWIRELIILLTCQLGLRVCFIGAVIAKSMLSSARIKGWRLIVRTTPCGALGTCQLPIFAGKEEEDHLELIWLTHQHPTVLHCVDDAVSGELAREHVWQRLTGYR